MGTKKSGPVGADAGPLIRFGEAMTARTILNATATAGSFSIVEQLLASRELAAPLHMHSRENEFTVVLTGRIGFLLGEEVFHAGPGELVRKPKNQWHTFWNTEEEPARVLEIISPAGFEKYFGEIEPASGSPTPLKWTEPPRPKGGHTVRDSSVRCRLRCPLRATGED